MRAYFTDREPVEPFELTVPARRTVHLRFNDVAPIPRDTDCTTLIEPDAPIAVQHFRLDSRKPENALLSTTAYAE